MEPNRNRTTSQRPDQRMNFVSIEAEHTCRRARLRNVATHTPRPSRLMMIVVQYLANSLFNTDRFVRIGDSESGAVAATAAQYTERQS